MNIGGKFSNENKKTEINLENRKETRNMSEWGEEYLKRFSNSEEQNETAEAEREESSGYLDEVAQMVEDLEELLYERDTLMLRYFECLVRLQTMETHRTDIS